MLLQARQGQTVEDMERELSMPVERLRDIMTRLRKVMDDGLADKDSEIMLPTFVHDIPNGLEKGRFLAIDLGGSNFRVLLVELDPRSATRLRLINSPKFPKLKDDIIQRDQKVLFDHIALCVKQFLAENGIEERLPLGFTFSFAVKQTSLTRGVLQGWSKKFDADGAVGEDVVRLLREALARNKVWPDLELRSVCASVYQICILQFIEDTCSRNTRNKRKWTSDAVYASVVETRFWIHSEVHSAGERSALDSVIDDEMCYFILNRWMWMWWPLSTTQLEQWCHRRWITRTATLVWYSAQVPMPATWRNWAMSANGKACAPVKRTQLLIR